MNMCRTYIINIIRFPKYWWNDWGSAKYYLWRWRKKKKQIKNYCRLLLNNRLTYFFGSPHPVS